MNALVLFVSLVVFSNIGLAEDGKNKMTIEEKKTKVLGKIDQKIDSLNQFKSCVAAATEKSAIKKCREANRTRMKAIHPNRKKK